MTRASLGLVVAGIIAAAGRARADTPAPAAAPALKELPAPAPPSYSHKLQVGLAVMPGVGYRVIFPYQATIYCGQAGKTVCTQRLPTFLDLQPSFGFGNHWDVIFDLRLGLERDFTQSRELAFAPGVRYWIDPKENAKFFATLQVAYDVTRIHDAMVTNDDWAVRNSNGFMFEPLRNLGVYLQFGETIGFVRWLRFEIDAGLGVQARFP
ncbi:MAG TPA: hypothetical protein VHJ20_12070 [Polyangia bacterium]|nr:hypothetical protein [Polyangia bacterium]